MSSLPLPDLHIRNFRLFSELTIPRLGRLNLITGANGAGKTCLLEAIELWAGRGSFDTVRHQARRRQQPIQLPRMAFDEERSVANVLQVLSGFFAGWPDLWAGGAEGEIGTARDMLQFKVTIPGANRSDEPDAAGVAELADSPQWHASAPGSHSWQRLDLGQASPREPKGHPCSHLPAGGLELHELAERWDFAGLTPSGMQVEEALERLHPGTGRVGFVEQSGMSGRVPMVQYHGARRPVPVKQLGDGAMSLLGIGYSMERAVGGLLLIDEFENGLHHAFQERVWELIARHANELNFQVVATTHSWDCVEAFQAATEGLGPEEALVHRLDKVDDKPRLVTFADEDLAVAVRHGLELR